MPPSVTVIIPVYNAENYLIQCLKSVLGQTLQDIEIICIDDGSTDKSSDLLASLQQKDTRLTILQGSHGGPSKARNLGLEQARGKYVSFVDSDDTIEPDMLESMYRTALENNADLAVCGLALEFESPDQYNQGAVNWGKARHEGTEHAGGEIAGKLRTNVLDKLFRRELIETYRIRFSENLRLNEDGVFVWTFLTRCQVISFLGKNYYHYLQRTNSAIARIYTRQDDTVLQLIPSWSIMEEALLKAGRLEEYFFPFLDLVCDHVKHFGQYIPQSNQTEWQRDLSTYLKHIFDTYPNLMNSYRKHHPKQHKILFPPSCCFWKKIHQIFFK